MTLLKMFLDSHEEPFHLPAVIVVHCNLNTDDGRDDGRHGSWCRGCLVKLDHRQ